MKYIYSSSLKHYSKGKEAPDHKYTSREYKNGKWVYNYGDTNLDSGIVSSLDNPLYVYPGIDKDGNYQYNGESPEIIDKLFETGRINNLTFKSDEDAESFHNKVYGNSIGNTSRVQTASDRIAQKIEKDQNNKPKPDKNGHIIDADKHMTYNGESYAEVQKLFETGDILNMSFDSDEDYDKFLKSKEEYEKKTNQVAQHSEFISMEDCLYHHGIKGQKWGVENGPPYPLNETVKAIAYKGGKLDDGRQAVNFTNKDVQKARKIVNKNLKLMTEDEIKAYKARLLLENDLDELVGQSGNRKLKKELKDRAIKAVGDSVQEAGKVVLKNVELAGLNYALDAAFGSDVADIVTGAIGQQNKKKDKNKDEL